MEKRRLGGLLKTVVLTLVMVLLFGMTTMAATKVNMNKYKTGSYYYKGVWETSGTVYHKVTVPKTGILLVSGKGYDEYSSHKIKVALCDKNLKLVEKSYSYADDDSEKYAWYGVSKGTYYIKVTGEKDYFLLAVNQKVANKGGAKKSSAATVKKGKTGISGVIPASTKKTKTEKWYKFKVTQSKVLVLYLSAIGNGKFTFTVYGPSYSKGFKIASFMNDDRDFTSGNVYTRTPMRVKKGTYYLKVTRNSKSSGAVFFSWTLQ